MALIHTHSFKKKWIWVMPDDLEFLQSIAELEKIEKSTSYDPNF